MSAIRSDLPCCVLLPPLGGLQAVTDLGLSPSTRLPGYCPPVVKTFKSQSLNESRSGASGEGARLPNSLLFRDSHTGFPGSCPSACRGRAAHAVTFTGSFCVEKERCALLWLGSNWPSIRVK